MDNTTENHLPFKNDSEYSGFDNSLSKSRRSSILKPPKARAPLLEINYSDKNDNEDFEANRKRRVSFAGVTRVKEFNSKVGTIHSLNTPSYDELFSSSDSSEILQSETYDAQTEDAKTEKEARLIMNIISPDDSFTSLVNNESNDNIEFHTKNTSSFNQQTFNYLNEKQDENKCLSESYNESNGGMDLTQPIVSDKMQESIADMSLESNLISEIQIPSDVRAGNNGMKTIFDKFTTPSDSQLLPLNILQNVVSSSKVENTSKEIPKRVECIYEQPRKEIRVENISSDNQQFIEPCFKKLAQETCKVIPLNLCEMDSDLNNSVDMEFTEAIDKIEGIENNLMEKQKMKAESVSRRSMINTVKVTTLDDSSNMEFTDACILRELENNGNTLYTNKPTSKNSTNIEFVNNACILKSVAKMTKEDDPPVVQNKDCSLNMELTEAYTLKSTEINFPFNNVFKSVGSSKEETVKSGLGNQYGITNCSSNINLQDHNCSAMEVTETCVNMPADYIKSNIFKEAPENECSSNMEFTNANVEFSRKKENSKSVSVPNEIHSTNMEITGYCSVKPSEDRKRKKIETYNTENILNEYPSNMKFTDACSKSIGKFKEDRFKNNLNSENALVRNTESRLVIVSENKHSLTQDDELNCSMELTEVCKSGEEYINFFGNNQQNSNTACAMEFTKACVINPVAVTTNSIPLTKVLESSSNMEFTDVCEMNPSNVAKNILPFSKGELSDMEFTGACEAISSDIKRNDIPLTKDRGLSNEEFTDKYVTKPLDIINGSLSSNMEFTEAHVAKSPEVTNNYLPITKNCHLSSDVEFTEAYMAKPPDVGGSSLPFTKSRDLSSNMGFTEACINNAARNSLPFINDGDFSLTVTKAPVSHPPDITRNSLPFMKNHECSESMEFTNISSRCDKKEINSRVNIDKIASHTENEKNCTNQLNNQDNVSKNVTLSENSNCAVALKDKVNNFDHSSSSEKPLDLKQKKSVQDTSASLELSASLNKVYIDVETAPSDDGSKVFGMQLNDSASVSAFKGFFQTSAANSISLKMGDIPSTAKVDENQESNLINFDRNISYMKEIGNCDFAYKCTKYVSTDIKKNLDSVGINFSNNEHMESDIQTIDMDITYSGKLEKNDVVLSRDENGGRKNISETLDISGNDELDNKKQLLLRESIINMDMTHGCDSQPTNSKVDINESFLVRSKAKMNERKCEANIEGDRLTKEAKIVKESSNKKLYEASKVNEEIVQCAEEIYLQQEQIERSNFTNAEECESQKLQNTIEHETHVEKDYSNDISPIFEDTSNKLEEIHDKEVTKNTSKENEIHVQQVIQPSNLPNFPVAEDSFHLYDVKNAKQGHLAETVEIGSAQDHHLNYTPSKSISDNTIRQIDTDFGNSQVQDNYEMIEVGGKILSQKQCEKLNLNEGVADDLGKKEEISSSHKDKQGFISDSNRISQLAMGADKNVESKTVEKALNANVNIQDHENEAELSASHVSKDDKIVRKCLQAGPTFSFLNNSVKKKKTTWVGTLGKEGPSFSSSYLQKAEYRSCMEHYKLNVENLKFMSDLGFSRISFTEWRYNLTETLSIVFKVPYGRVDKSTCLETLNYVVNKQSDPINLYISEVIKQRYTEEWLKSECITVKDVLQTSNIIMKERLEIKKFYKTVNYLYRFYPCKFNKNRISFYIVDIKAGVKFDVDIHIDGWKKIKAENIKVISSIGHFREELVRRLFTSILDDEKRLINFVKILEAYCKSLNNAT